MKQIRVAAVAAILIVLIANTFFWQKQVQAQAITPTAVGTPSAPPPVRAGDRVVAEGEAEPTTYVSVNFSIPGTVAEVLVKEGDTVSSGQELARLKPNAQLRAGITAAELELLSAQQALDKINKDANVARANAQLIVAQTNKALDKAKDERQSKAYKRANQSTIDLSRAAYIVAQDAYKSANEKWQGYVAKDENDVNRAEVLGELAKARQDLDRTKANLDYVEAYPDAFELAIAEGELQVAQANYDKALRDYDLVKNGPNLDDVALAEARIARAQDQLTAARAAPDDQVLTAPMAGVIVDLGLKAGEQAGPAKGAVLIADLSKYQVITTDLTELNVVNIKEGQAVNISFDALPELEATGKVLKIKALGVDKQGDITYSVTISLDQQDPRLRWKMTASVSFVTE